MIIDLSDMKKQIIKFKNKLPVISGILYLLTAAAAVSSAWLSSRFVYDLRLSFSAYVGLSYATSVLYFITAVIISALMAFYLTKTKMPLIKKLVYAVVFLCILGTALFPHSESEITSNLHQYFAVGGMLAVALTYILSLILAKNKKQRIAAGISLIYALIFSVLFFMGFEPLFETFFIWENMFIILLILELHMEQYGETSDMAQLDEKYTK